MENAALLAELRPVAVALLDRHLVSSRPWYSADIRDIQHEIERLGPQQSLIADGVRRALVVGVLTELNLPFYFAGIHERFGREAPWWDWLRQWTAEEMQHGLAIRDYLLAARLIDTAELERNRVRHVTESEIPPARTAAEAFVYLAIQELATRIAHRNTGTRLPDRIGRQLMSRIASDENRHFLFYRDLVRAAIGIDPEAVINAIDVVVRHFSMPGAAIAGFEDHRRAIAEAGIFSAVILVDDVMTPLVERDWAVPASVLSETARLRQTRTHDFLMRLRTIAPRLDQLWPGPDL